PAVYYAHLASNRARSHEDIAEPERRIRDAGDPSKSSSGKPGDEAPPLLPMIPRDGLPWGTILFYLSILHQALNTDFIKRLRKAFKMAEVAEELEAGGAKQTFKELFSGAAGGVAQVLIGEWGFVLM
ncbi:MAG: hypothetical protein Q9204_009013, partial [Flavoplaca sp. TL-2023a]